MLCQKCTTSEPPEEIEQSAVNCKYCNKDLSEAPDGTTICKNCADMRQLCQRCGQPLRLSDFSGIFVCGSGSTRLHRSDEKQIIALLLKRTHK